MTMHALYQLHGHAFDLTAQARLMSTPEHGVSEFAAFCELWPKVMELLETPAKVDYQQPSGEWIEYRGYVRCFLGYILAHECGKTRPVPRRIVLLDGTVIREWGGVPEEQATLYVHGKLNVWRIDAHGPLSEMLQRAEERSIKKDTGGQYRFGIRVVDTHGKVHKEWERVRS